MKPDEILSSDDFRRCADFHGHVCPGLAIGYRASKAGLERLREDRSPDEEIVAIVETDACCADAVQVLTGCTFGKGNFIYKNYGKTAFTFLSRRTGEGVRIVSKPGARVPDKRHRELMAKVGAGDATPEEQEEFKNLHIERSGEVLIKPLEELFSIENVTIALPDKARIEPSKSCSRCGEPVMASKLEVVCGEGVCRECLSLMSKGGSEGNGPKEPLKN